MIEAVALSSTIRSAGIEFYTGVPDSVLKNLTPYFPDLANEEHIVAANEGAAVALACGVYLSTRKLSLVYMQNSGLGNAINPLLSLAGSEVYSIPMLLLIGWRGGPGSADEPQHRHQGRATTEFLENLSIPHWTLGPDTFEDQVRQAVEQCRKSHSPSALLVPRGILSGGAPNPGSDKAPKLPRRSVVLKRFLEHFEEEILVSTTGWTSRELYQIRQDLKGAAGLEFLNVGAMGHASQIALGLAIQTPAKQVVCLDGDGSVLMHGGNLATVGQAKPKNFKHLVLNNGTHESVGGQAVCGSDTDYCKLAEAFGYRWTRRVADASELDRAVRELRMAVGPALLEVKVGSGTLANLGRPSESPVDRKKTFMERLKACKN